MPRGDPRQAAVVGDENPGASPYCLNDELGNQEMSCLDRVSFKPDERLEIDVMKVMEGNELP